jgi:hypothetical protein
MTQPEAHHRTIVVVDIADYTDPARTAAHQAAAHDGLYRILGSAFADAGVDLERCFTENRGDGALILVPSDISKSAFANRLPDGLLRALHRHNAVHSAQAAIRLRVALHAGEVRLNSRGAVSPAISFAFRILDAGAARAALKRAGTPLSLVVSDSFFHDVVEQDPAAAPEEYRQIPVHVKRTSAHAWLRVPRLPEPAPSTGSAASTGPASRRRALTRRVSPPRFAVHALSAFGVAVAATALADVLLDTAVRQSWQAMAVSAAVGVAWGVRKGLRPVGAHRDFRHPATAVRVVVGDLFDQPGHLVVGFTDTFDTDTAGDLVISGRSVQGQLLSRRYAGDVDRLDRDLAEALDGVEPHAVIAAGDKRLGKLTRYPIGTVAVLPADDGKVFCSAYSTMGDDLVARSTVDALWTSLGLLWAALAEHGQRRPVALPVLGSELARIDLLDRENLIKLILLSYVARSREHLLCKELTIVVHPDDAPGVDLAEVAAFLRRL